MKDVLENKLRVIFRLDDKVFSIHSSFVEAMDVITSIRKVPQAPNYLRGILELRGKVIPLLDLRTILGMPSLESNNQEILNNLVAFQDEHEKLEILLTDIDYYKNEKLNKQLEDLRTNKIFLEYNSENIFFQEAIFELRFPHKKLHQVIVTYLKTVVEDKDKSKSDQLMLQLKDKEFPRFNQKIKDAIKTITSKANEIYIVLGYDGKLVAVTADSIFTVDHVDIIDKNEAGIYEFFNKNAQALIESVGRNKKINDLVINMSTLEFFKNFDFETS